MPRIPNIDRIDIRNTRHPPPRLRQRIACDNGRLVVAGRGGGGLAGVQRIHHGSVRPAERDAAGEAVAHGAPHVERARLAGDGEAGAARARHPILRQTGPQQARQFQFVQEVVEKFLPRQRELERVLAAAAPGAPPAAAGAAALRLLDPVAAIERARTRQNIVVLAFTVRREARLLGAIDADLDLLTALKLGDAPPRDGIRDRFTHVLAHPLEEPLAIVEAFALRIRPPIDDDHPVLRLTLTSGRACTIPPRAAPGVPCTRAPSCERRNPNACGPSRRLSSRRS